jgi:hypothetical protein
VTEKAWQSFAAASATAFDGLVAALGRPDLASNQKVPPPPDTELSLFTSDNDLLVQALLLESPEPLPWRRMWQWTSLQPEVLARPLSGLTILWSSDQTRALIVPLGRPAGRYGITLGGTCVSETPTLAPIRLGPQRPRIPVDRGPAGPARDPIA